MIYFPSYGFLQLRRTLLCLCPSLGCKVRFLVSYYCKQISDCFSRQIFVICFPNNKLSSWNTRAFLAKRFPDCYPVHSTRAVYHSCSSSLGAVFVVDRVSHIRRLWKPFTSQEAIRSHKTRILANTTVWNSHIVFPFYKFKFPCTTERVSIVTLWIVTTHSSNLVNV
jgi:hypothetical protein